MESAGRPEVRSARKRSTPTVVLPQPAGPERKILASSGALTISRCGLFIFTGQEYRKAEDLSTGRLRAENREQRTGGERRTTDDRKQKAESSKQQAIGSRQSFFSDDIPLRGRCAISLPEGHRDDVRVPSRKNTGTMSAGTMSQRHGGRRKTKQGLFVSEEQKEEQTTLLALVLFERDVFKFIQGFIEGGLIIIDNFPGTVKAFDATYG